MKLLSITTFILLTFGLATTSLAQNDRSRLGVKAGLNISNFYSSDIDDQNTLLGFHAGLYYRMPMGDFFAIQPELLFNQKGADFGGDGFFTDEVSLRLNYIELPILAVVRLGDNLNIHAGPYIGYLIGDPSGSLSGVVDAQTTFDRDNFHTFDYGLAGGLGFEIAPLKIGIRYNLGLSDIGKDNLADQVLGSSRNSVIQFYIGL